MSNILNNSNEPAKSNFGKNSINLIQIMSQIPIDPLHTPIMPKTEMHK